MHPIPSARDDLRFGISPGLFSVYGQKVMAKNKRLIYIYIFNNDGYIYIIKTIGYHYMVIMIAIFNTP